MTETTKLSGKHFPKMIELRQTYPASPRLDYAGLMQQQFVQTGLRAKIRPGMKIAVGVGSRGITNLKEIVQATLGVLIAAGAQRPKANWKFWPATA